MSKTPVFTIHPADTVVYPSVTYAFIRRGRMVYFVSLHKYRAPVVSRNDGTQVNHKDITGTPTANAAVAFARRYIETGKGSRGPRVTLPPHERLRALLLLVDNYGNKN